MLGKPAESISSRELPLRLISIQGQWILGETGKILIEKRSVYVILGKIWASLDEFGGFQFHVKSFEFGQIQNISDKSFNWNETFSKLQKKNCDKFNDYSDNLKSFSVWSVRATVIQPSKSPVTIWKFSQKSN